MKSVQVIIPSINLWDKYTKPCIDSVVKACEGLNYRILLIDNGSTDNTREEAGKLVSSTFAHQRNEETWGCAQSWNFGVRDAFSRNYDLVLVVNNDVLLHPDSIHNLVVRFDNGDEGLAMATCLDVTGECAEPPAVFNLDAAEKITCPESEHPCFSGFMIDKNCFEKVGAFDENFKPAYFEDNDYHYRINLLGMKAIVLPTAMFYHYGSRTREESGVAVVTNQSFEKNREYYQDKWGGIPGQETFKTPFNK